MADFCLDCIKKVFPKVPEGANDFVGITGAEDTKSGQYALVLCEGCGWIYVDHTGKKVNLPAVE